MKLNFTDIRKKSFLIAKKLGYAPATPLPLFDASMILRPVNQIVDRALALNVVLATTYGYKDGLAYLKKENLLDSLTQQEERLFNGDNKNISEIQLSTEAVYALAWALGFVKELDFSKYCPNDLIKSFPDLKKETSSDGFRNKTKLRSLERIVTACDLAACLHWAIVQASLEKKPVPGKVRLYVVAQRRLALEWMLSKEDWDEVFLDT